MAGVKRDTPQKGAQFGQLLFVLSLVFLSVSLFNLGWSVWPMPTQSVQFAIPAGIMAGAPAGETYASLSDYNLSISWPQRLRAGELGIIAVKLSGVGEENVSQSIDRVAQVVLVEPAMVGLPVNPPGSVQANLDETQNLALNWEVTGLQTGYYPGKMYISFGFYDETLAELVPVPVAVVDLSIRVTALWGLETGLVLWFGVVGLVLWGALFILGRLAQGK